MAQVKKFQNGGKTFKIAGYTFNTNNKDDMKMLQELASDSTYGGIAQGVLDNVNDNSYANTLNAYRTADGRVVMEGELQHVKDKHMSEGVQKATSRKDTWLNNTFKRRSAKEWGENLDSFLSEITRRKNATPSENNSDEKIKITGVGAINNGKWGYDDQGLWNEASVDNQAIMKEWQLLEDYFNASEEDRKNKYDVSGLDSRSLEAYLTMRQNNPELYNQYKLKFTDKSAKIADNDDFYSTYGWFGFTPGSAEEIAAAKAAADNKALKEYLATQGLDFDGAENVFYRDEDGNLMVTDAFLTNVLKGDRNGHYWLNDNWADLLTENGNPNPFKQMRNHIIWNGRVYKQDDAAVLAELQKSGYIDANKAYDVAKAEKIMRTQWSDDPTFAHEAYDPKTMYSHWANGINGLRYRRLEANNLGDGEELIGYYSDDDPVDNYGFRTERYAIIGPNGKLIKDNVNPAEYAKTKNGRYVSGTANFMTQRLGEDAGILAGTYINGTDVNGKPSNTFFYSNPDTGEFFIQDPDLKGDQKGKVVRIPKEIAKLVPESAWEYFRTHKDAKDRLFKYLNDFTNTGWSKFWNDRDGLFGARNISMKNDFLKAGLDPEVAEQIVNLLNKWGTNRYYREQTGSSDSSTITRQNKFLGEDQTAGLVQPFKDGGVIEKHQYGNVLGSKGKTETKKMNVKSSTTKDADTNQSFGFGSEDSKQWSSLDTAELIATVGDLGSLALSFVPGAHLGAAGVGAAASTAQFVTDIKRDGFQGKDALNYLVNLGFDAMSGVTGAGGKAAKIMKNFKNTARILRNAIKAGAIVGVGDAVYNTIDKIAKGESFTLSDVRRIANGVAGATTLGKTGILSPKNKKVDVTPEVKIKPKSGKTASEISLNSDEVAQVLSKGKNEQVEELTQILANKTGKTSTEVADLYDIKALLKDKKVLQPKFWKGRKTVPNLELPKQKSKKVPMEEKDIKDLAAKRNGFQNWFFGTGKTQRAYNAFLRGKQPAFSHKINVKGTPYWETGYKPAIEIPEGSAPGLVPMEYFAKQITPTRAVISSHKSPFKKSFFRLHTPNFGSHQQFPQEMQWTEEVNPTPMPRLIFKKGGVLKGQSGLQPFVPKTIAGKIESFGSFRPGEIRNPSLNLTTPSKYERFAGDLMTGGKKDSHIRYDALGRSENLLDKTIPYTPITQQTTEPEVKVAGTSIVRPGSDSELSIMSGPLMDLGHLASQWEFANQLNKLGKDRKKAYMLGSPEVWNGSGPMRIILPNFNAENRARGKYLTNLNQSTITTDPMLKASGMKGGYDNLLDSEMDSIRNISNNVMQQWAMNDNIRREDKKLTFETLRNKKQYDSVGAQMEPMTDVETTTIKSRLLNDHTVAQRKKLYDYNTIDAAINDKKYQIELAIAEGKTKGQDVSSLENMLKTLSSDDHRQSQLRRVYAKKGSKLRSTTEQMLLDNQKLVAKAIEKLNDSTMKLILKVMS